MERRRCKLTSAESANHGNNGDFHAFRHFVEDLLQGGFIESEGLITLGNLDNLDCVAHVIKLASFVR